MKAGTLSALIGEYYVSVEFKGLAESSKATYRRMLERFKQKHGDRLVADLQTKHVLMKFAIGAGYREDNPVAFAKKIKHKSTGFRTWTEEDIASFRAHWPVGSPQRIAMEILLNTGLRRSDAVRLGRQHIKDETISIDLKKSQGLIRVDIPSRPRADLGEARAKFRSPEFDCHHARQGTRREGV